VNIELPWFPKQLSPNFRSRSHWPRTKALKKARKWAYVAGLAADRPHIGDGHVALLLTFYPATAHKRDKDNLLASCKAYLDGLADAWGCNDSQFDPRVAIAEPVKNPRIIVSVMT
jgi:crossover junction endodeoxyribonuclease RusA